LRAPKVRRDGRGRLADRLDWQARAVRARWADLVDYLWDAALAEGFLIVHFFLRFLLENGVAGG
jgi:hypothetical protein